MESYDRYSQFRYDDKISVIPFVEIRKQPSDFYEIYQKGKSRLDLISFDYYNDSNYGWLILQANPEVGSMEYEIPDNTELRIPYPLGPALETYRQGIEEYNKYYSNE